MEFRRDPVTGDRIYKSKYRPYRVKSTRKPTRAGSIADVDEDYLFVQQADELPPYGKFDDLLKDADNLLLDWKGNKRRDWGKRMEMMNTNWEASRKFLFEEMLKVSAPNVHKCCRCNSEAALFRCSQCVYNNLCALCDEAMHRSNPLHDREVILDGFYQNIRPTLSVNSDGSLVSVKRIFPPLPATCPDCGIVMEIICNGGHLIIITLQGRFDLDVASGFHCSKCDKTTAYEFNITAALRLGYWPGTPSNLCHLFDTDLLYFWDLSQKRMPGVSERAFISSLEDYSSAKGRIGVINISTFSRAFKEWKFCHYELEMIQQKNWMICPACAKQQHSAHTDGNMKLYRFNSAGRRQRQCYYGEAFIASNSKVDAHLQQIYKGTKKKEATVDNSKCGDTSWRAAGNTVKKKKNLDETGLEILGCRHSMTQAAVNMFYGEIYGYAYYLQKAYLVPKEVQFLWYDVICKYWPWLVKQDPICAQKMKPALSVMHAKAHAWTCQVLWGGRWQKGASATTGEEVEQINSHFSRLGNSTKHMLPEGREELLTEHALSWNKKKIVRLPLILSKRFVKVKQQEIDANNRLTSLLVENGVPTNNMNEKMNEWINEVQAVAREEELTRRNKVTISFDEEVFLVDMSTQADQSSPKAKYLLTRAEKMYPKFFAKLRSAGHQRLSQDLHQKCEDDSVWDDSLKHGETVVFQKVQTDLQFKIESLHFSIMQLAANMGKLTDSSKQRTRLRNKLSTTKAELQGYVDGLKQLQSTSDINMEDVQQGIFPWLPESRQAGVPFRVKKMAGELTVESRRYAEEAELLKQEIGGFLAYYKDIVLPSLKQQEDDLMKQLQDVVVDSPPDFQPSTVDMSVAPELSASDENENGRYATNSHEESILKGKIALTRSGMDFAMDQIASGMVVFRKVLAENTYEISEVLRQFDDTADDDHQVDNPDESGDEDEIDISESGSDDVVPASTVLETSLPIVHSTTVSSGIHVWKFPIDFSQGCVDGRNGSSACSIIALIIAQVIAAHPDLQTPIQGTISPLWSTLLYQSMVSGNNIYDRYRANLPARYLSAAEAYDILTRHDNFAIETEEPLPVRLVDEHRLSTIEAQLASLAETPERKMAVLTICERTSLFVVQAPDIIYLDTHCHLPDGGAVIVVGHSNLLNLFCASVWDLTGLGPNTFGNLVTITQP